MARAPLWFTVLSIQWVLWVASGSELNDIATETTTTTTEVPLCVQPEEEEAEALPLYVTLPMILLLVMMSGLFSGLTLGLMGLDPIGLEVVANGDNTDAARCAAKIKPIRERGNMLLCTLLLGNVAVNSALSILTSDISSGTVGFFVSTGLIVVFGEILPQAACSKYALQVGSRTVVIVQVLMAMMFVVTYPMSMILDKMLGKDLGQVYSTAELMEMVKLHLMRGTEDEQTGQMVKDVVEGAVRFRNKTVKDVMTPLNDTYMISSETKLGYETVRDIFETGFSRIPVFGRDKQEYKGLLLTKDLILADPEDEMKVVDFIQIFNRQALSFAETASLPEALALFKKGTSHLGLVRKMNLEDHLNPQCELVGVLTLEDVVEEILNDEVVDEGDVYVDVDNHIPVAGRLNTFDLGLFNPKWRGHEERLACEEVSAIASHLSRAIFSPGSSIYLDFDGVKWLVSVSRVQSWKRETRPGSYEDELYRVGCRSTQCTLVLQGRATVTCGNDLFKSEAGAFTVLGKDALVYDHYVADFSAVVSTGSGRFLHIEKETFEKAKELAKDPEQLRKELEELQNMFAALTADMKRLSPRSPLRRHRQWGRDGGKDGARRACLPCF